MTRKTREQRLAQRAEIAERWARWLKTALEAEGMLAADLARKSGGALDTGKISHWTAGDNSADAESVILVAKLLRRDAIEALREAGHPGIAQFAADLRANAIEALVKNELDAIEQDDPYLADLDAEHDNHIVTDDEHARLREDYLRRKRASILRMREDYRDALADKDEHGSPPAGSNGASAAM